MPGFKTHSIFGILSARHLPDGYIKKCITKYPHAYQMGHQGPDFMFYYVPLHLLYKKNPGEIMHSTLVNEFFDSLFKARNNVKKADQPLVDSYISGFIGHYTLDSAIHPYIYLPPYLFLLFFLALRFPNLTLSDICLFLFFFYY